MWLHACKLTAVQHNQSVTSLDLARTPLSKRYNDDRPPRELIVMGSPAYTLIHKEEGRMGILSMPAFVGHFTGFDPDSSSYLIYNKPTKAICSCCDVMFDQHWRYNADLSVDNLYFPVTYNSTSLVLWGRPQMWPLSESCARY